MRYIFRSILSKELNDYVMHRINNGFTESSHYFLTVFDSFLLDKKIQDKNITKELIDEWALQKPTENKNTRNSRVNAVKQFTLYLNSIGIQSFIPNYHFSKSKNVPYVLDDHELILLFQTIDGHFNEYDFQPTYHYKYMIPVLFRLLYSSGLRNNEACQLKLEDINYSNNSLTIKNSKNNKDRVVYLGDDMFNLLDKYLQVREKFISSLWVFPSRNPNKPIIKTSISDYFHNAVLKAQIGSPSHYPTPHSLRHTYVVKVINQWTKNGYKVDILMPYLSKQLGHSTIEETFYYYHMLETSYESIISKDRNLLPEVSLYEED